MATVVEKFPKAADPTGSKVEKERQARLSGGATSSVITDDGTNWVLTSVWPVVGATGS